MYFSNKVNIFYLVFYGNSIKLLNFRSTISLNLKKGQKYAIKYLESQLQFCSILLDGILIEIKHLKQFKFKYFIKATIFIYFYKETLN